MIIKNMGLFWRPEEVYWGRKKSPGRLLGYARLSKNGIISPDVEDIVENENDLSNGQKKPLSRTLVNFRNQIGVYALYQDFRIVYVGKAGANTSIFTRLRAHKGDHLAGRWNMFSWFGLKAVNMTSFNEVHELCDYDETMTYKCDMIVNHLEGILIEVLENTENRKGASFNGTVKFLQKRDPSLPPTMNEMIKELYEHMPKIAKVKNV